MSARKPLDVPAKITATAVLHVQMQLVGSLHVVSRHISNDICVLETLQHSDLSMQLLLLPLRHRSVGNLLARKHLARALPLDLANYAE